MGKLDNGAYGHVNGKIGNLVSYTLNGENVIRKIGRSTKPPTNAQRAVQQKIKRVNQFLNPILGYIKVGFSFAVERTGRYPHNMAVSCNVKNAMTGEYPNIEIDYSKALVSMGKLPTAINPNVQRLDNGVEFTWDVTDDMDWNIKNDRAMLLLFFPGASDAIYFLSGAKRSEGRDFVELPAAYLSTQMQCYIAFYADNKQSLSNSIWAGSL